MDVAVSVPNLATDRSWRANALLPVISGVALVLAFPPYSVPALPFVGLVPLFLYFSGPLTVRKVAVGTVGFALPYFFGNIYWLFALAHFTPMGVLGALGAILLHLTTFLFFPVGVNVLRHAEMIPFVLAAPVFWTVSEHARTFGDFSFPWVTLGYTVADWPRLAQHADLVGVYGISFWLVLVNALVAAACSNGTRRGARTGFLLAALVVVAVPTSYGAWRWRSVEAAAEGAPRITVAIAQPDIEQNLKWDPASRSVTIARLVRTLEQAEALGPDLVLGPEASFPMIVSDSASRLPSEIPDGSRPLLIGMVRGRGRPERVATPDGREAYRFRSHFNSAVLAGPDRRIVAVHDKQYLVPITEQVPYRRVFGFLLPFMRKQFGRFAPGESLRVLDAPADGGHVRIGALVCYESLSPALSRRMVRLGADLLANVTNDAWFGRSSMSPQHVGLLVLRAIETRRSVVRSANSGVSAWIDPLGRVRKRTPLFEQDVFLAEPALLNARTVYCRFGDVVVYACYLVAASMLVLVWRQHERHGTPRR